MDSRGALDFFLVMGIFVILSIVAMFLSAFLIFHLDDIRWLWGVMICSIPSGFLMWAQLTDK